MFCIEMNVFMSKLFLGTTILLVVVKKYFDCSNILKAKKKKHSLEFILILILFITFKIVSLFNEVLKLFPYFCCLNKFN